MPSTQLHIHKQDLFQSQIKEAELLPLKSGEVRFKLRKYAITSNNVTYAVTGHQIGYWKFFPVDEEWGMVPVWGFAEVVESQVEGIEKGEMCYGYFPMADHLKVEVGKLSPYGFMDFQEHRRELPPIYNYYNRIGADPSYHKSFEDYIPIIRPLFATSFLNYQFLKSSDFFEASQVVLTSASSKTALGLAYLLKEHQETHGKKIVGLTSGRNVDFVQGTGFYDIVVSYDDVEDDLPDTDSLVVDLAGNGKLLTALHEQLDDKLKFISMIGLADWQSGVKGLSIPQSKFFFAPSFAQKLYKEWGQEKANSAIAENMAKFIGHAKSWIDIEYVEDYEALSKLFSEMAKGKVNPAIGYIVKR